MRVEFHGAARTVTGSCTLLEAAGRRILVDCGQFQGDARLERRNREPFGFDPASIDALVLTHGHIDHVGRAPTLLRAGFTGTVWCTRSTAEIAAVMLLDGAKIAAEDAEREGREPAYGPEDVARLHARTTALGYGETRELAPGIAVTLSDAGHILGSAHVRAHLVEDGREFTFGVSGDVGMRDRPVVADPTPMAGLEALQVETTYGDRDHRDLDESVAELLHVLEDVERTRGLAIVPAFSLGRTQDVLYRLNGWKNEGRLRDLKVYVDSPLATRLTAVFRRNTAVFDDDAKGLLARGDDPFDFPGLRYVRDARESRELTENARGAVILAGSGMCQGGRVVHHLLARLHHPETRVVFLGYQAEGTLGRRLVDRARSVRIRGHEVHVAATIHTLGGFSAHAGREQLLEWIGGAGAPPRTVYLVHGERRSQDAFAQVVRDRFRVDVRIPEHGQSFDL